MQKDFSQRDFISHAWEPFYSTGMHNLADDFYGPAISKAVLIERAVGFFKSTAYLLLYEEFCEFLMAGGKVKLICSPFMHRDDQQVMQSFVGNISDHNSQSALIEEIKKLQDTETGNLHIKLLGGMLRFGMLEIKIALTSDGDGMFHEKIGILHDSDGNILTFSGSANETLCAWGMQGNVESFDVFRSWSESDSSRIATHRNVFKKAWDGKRPGVTTIDLAQAVRDRLLEDAPHDKDEMRRAFTAFQKLKKDLLAKQRKAPGMASKRAESDDWPSGRVAEPHQRTALQAWHDNHGKGILKHATGSGKTFTALHAIRNHMRLGGVTLVVVPSELLFDGWKREMRAEMPEAIFLYAGSGNVTWKSAYRLEAFTQQVKSSDRRIILSTMQTASDVQFIRRLKNTEKMLLVADEVHQIGSREISHIMDRDFGFRLGLSATPERYGDPEGTKNLLKYFGGIVGKEFTLKDAMAAGRLVPYRYYPEFVFFNETEREQWREITLQIRRTAAYLEAGETNTPGADRLKKLLIRRARIAKKAQGKVALAARILRENYRQDQYWLVYCEDQDQLSQVTTSLHEAGLNPFIYHSSMEGDSKRTLASFVADGGIIVAIRCLDEGVDIPVISHAIILASSQNPRQFIQRRGRVLRTAAYKNLAYIWDALVMPVDEQEDAQYQDALTRAELLRAIEFANTASNQAQASELRMKALELGLDAASVYPDEEDATS